MANIKSQIKRNRQNERRRVKQQGGALRAEDAHEERAHRGRDRRRGLGRAPPRGREADRQGRSQGRHPRQPGVPAQVASGPPHRRPHRRGRRGELSLCRRRRFVARPDAASYQAVASGSFTAGLPPSRRGGYGRVAARHPELPDADAGAVELGRERSLEGDRDGIVEPGLVPLPGPSEHREGGLGHRVPFRRLTGGHDRPRT